ncbi:hypothetical protein LINPERPRIM_LOCUS38329 [Linum perenne]
MEDTVIY